MTFDLQLGAVDLLGTTNTSPGYWFQTYGEGLDLGSPEAVEREITSFLQDGSIATIESWDNRTLTLQIGIRATTAANLAAGEQALVAEVGIRNVLTYTPSGNGSPCVFDVVNSKLANTFNEDYEAKAVLRVYTLTVVALPFARAGSATVASWAAPPAGAPTTATVDACTSTTGWARTTTGTGTGSGPTVVGAAELFASMTNTSAVAFQSTSVTLTRTGLSASMTSTPYVRLDAKVGKVGSAAPPIMSVQINGIAVSPTAQAGTVYWYAMPGGATTLTSVAVTSSGNVAKGGVDNLSVTVSDITRTSGTTDIAGQRQTYRSVSIAGSARTQGSIMLSDPTVALGSVLVYTTPTNAAVFQPPLRPFLVSGNTQTTDTSTISGKTSSVTSLHAFDIPASQVPAGTYMLMARLKNAATVTPDITWAGWSRMGGLYLDSTPQGGVKSVPLTAGVYSMVMFGNLVLPTQQVGPSGFVRIELTASLASTTLDEAWLFNLDTGRLSWVECGTGAAIPGDLCSAVFLDPSSLSSPVPSVTVGTATDRSDAFGAGSRLISFGDHEFLPGQMSIFTASTNSVAMAGSVTYSPRYMTHVA